MGRLLNYLLHNMFARIDQVLNSVTMYRLILYVLGVISLVGIVLSPTRLFSLLVISFAGYGANLAFAKLFKVAPNTESAAITQFILFLILFPAQTLIEYGILALVSVIAMASKYVLTVRNHHIFNPAAFGAFVASFMGGVSAWWVGSVVLFPFVAVGAFLIIRKTRRTTLFLSFALAAFASLFLSAQFTGLDAPLSALVQEGLLSWPIIFFGAFMLTEPLTLPAARKWQIAEAVLVGLLFAVPFQVGVIHSSPELALLLGNVLAFVVGVKRGYRLRFVAKQEVAPGVYNLTFASDYPLLFEPGQYMEVTLDDMQPDSRGNRRTFTIASKPGVAEAQFGIRIPEASSRFKKMLMQFTPGTLLFGSNLAGEFTLPKDVTRKFVFVAGGVGVTPFKSMVEDMLARKERRDIVLLYCCKTEADFAYRELFDRAASVGVRSVCIATDTEGFLNRERLMKEVPDFKDRHFYLSGPHVMVESYRKLLRQLGVARTQIHTDYFPGY